MRVEGATVFLSRRNLRALLIKLDNPDSYRTIANDVVFVTAEEDDVHYNGRFPGLMVDRTEDALNSSN